MSAPPVSKKLDHERTIIHFDYDCFYASVFENENPSLKSVPLAVQQKQIIVTCNYEARRRGLHKLQLITEAKKIVPDVVIVLGEDLGRFRDASKSLYKFLEAYTWNGKVERLGFDEVFMDVTDIVDFNKALLNPNDLPHSFFQLKRNDPTVGFSFNATTIAGPTFPATADEKISSRDSPAVPKTDTADDLKTRLILGSHIAQHLRWNLEDQKGYTSTVGISTNKLLAKLVGNLNKPKGQTTLLPPYHRDENGDSNITTFIDEHDIGKIPGIGFKTAQRIRHHVLSRAADFEAGLIYGGTKEAVSVRDVRLFPGIGPEVLEKILGGPGSERGIGGKIWALINGIDETGVQLAKKITTQISIEESYLRLDTMPQVLKELRMLATSLIKRMHTDLLEPDDDPDSDGSQRWIAHPKTCRLSTRPRLPLNADGTRTRSFNRISRSAPLPNVIFSLKDGIDAIVEKLVQDTLLPMFRRLHPQQSGWNLSLMNICVTNMVETANQEVGRDIGRMFRRQEDVLKEWKVEDRDVPPDPLPDVSVGVVGEDVLECSAEPSAGVEAEDAVMVGGSEDYLSPTQKSFDESALWEDEEAEGESREFCHECGAVMPAFAMSAHERFHSVEG